MEIKVLHEGLVQFRRYIALTKKLEFTPQEIKQIFDEVVNIYEHYCKTYFHKFLIKENTYKYFNIKVVWSIDNIRKTETGSVGVLQLSKAFNDKIPICKINMNGTMILRELSDIEDTSSTAKLLIRDKLVSILVHETIHIAQYTLESRRGIFLNLDIFKRMLGRSEDIFQRLSIMLSIIKTDNTHFIRLATLEGEAEYFGQQYGHYSMSIDEPDPDVRKGLINVRKFKSEFLVENKIQLFEKIISNSTKTVANVTKTLKEIFLLQKKFIVSCESAKPDVLEKNIVILRNKLDELDSNLVKYGSFEQTVYNSSKEYHYVIGYLVVQLLRQAKLWHYNLSPRALFDRFVSANLKKEVNNLQEELKLFLISIDESEKVRHDIINMLSNDAREIKKLRSKVDLSAFKPAQKI